LLNNFFDKKPANALTFSKSGQLSAKLSAKLSANQLSAKLSASRANFQQVEPTFSKTFSKWRIGHDSRYGHRSLSL
jgi:hypothetical protein